MSKMSVARPQSILITDCIFLLVFTTIFYLCWLGTHALFTPDEGRYSEVAREMLVTGDFITPRLNGVAFLDKPVLYYWLQASAIYMFGLKEWALRFWPAFIGVLGCWLTYFSGCKLFDRKTGVIAALILATSPLYYGGAHYANLDLEVSVLISYSLLLFLLFIAAKSLRSANLFLMASYLFAGFAALTKGLIGIFFPMMIIGAWIVLMNRWDLIKKMHLVLGLIIFAGIVVPWYVLVQKANPQFLHFFFVTQQVSRFLTTQAFNSKAVVWFYVPVVLAGIFPWCVFVVQALSQKIIAVYRDRKSHGYELYLLLWIVLVFIFFSIPRSKTVGYILPIFPAMALVIGHYLSIVWQNTQQKSLRIGLWSYILLALGISVLCFAAPHIAFFNVAAGLVKYLYMMGVSFLIAALLVFGLRHRSLFYSFAVIFGSAVLFLLVLLQSAAVLNEKTVKPLVMEVKSRLHPDDQIIAYYRYYQDLPIYLEKRIVIVADWNAPDIAQNDNWLRELWYGMSFQDTRQWLIDDNQFWKRWRSSQHLYVFARASDLEQFKAKAKGSLYEIKQSNGVVLLSNQSFPLPVPLSQ